LSPTRVLLLPLLTAALLLAAPAAAPAPVAGLGALHRVALEATVSPDHPVVAAEGLARRLEAALRAGGPAPAVARDSADVLRLTVSVSRVGATELRGFYLPFSGSYGLGSVRLAVERAVTVQGVAGPVRAVVWQAEHPVRVSWQRSGAAIVTLVDALAAGFLEDYRRAVGP
jgi:hypothetical protein